MATVETSITTHVMKDRRGLQAMQLVIISFGDIDFKLAECLRCDTDIAPRDDTIEAHEQLSSQMVSHVIGCKKQGRTLANSPRRSFTDLLKATGPTKSKSWDDSFELAGTMLRVD